MKRPGLTDLERAPSLYPDRPYRSIDGARFKVTTARDNRTHAKSVTAVAPAASSVKLAKAVKAKAPVAPAAPLSD